MGGNLNAVEIEEAISQLAEQAFAPARFPFAFLEAFGNKPGKMNIGHSHTIAIPAITSENREFLPCGLLNSVAAVTNKVYALYDGSLWNMALIASQLHWGWIGTVCVRIRTDLSYSNTLGWRSYLISIRR